MSRLVSVEGIKKTVFGCGAVDRIGEECSGLGVRRVLLIVDRNLSKTGILTRVEASLKAGRIRYCLFAEVTPEPAPGLADEGAEMARKEKAGCVIGLGGGSTMDVAKAAAVLVKNGGKAADYIGLDLVKKPGVPTVMIPTTAGTGSEVTFTSVFTMRETKSKGGINSPFLYPTIALLDPELTLDLPPRVTAFTGMDALTHAIESFTSVQAHFMSEPVSLEAVRIIGSNLRSAVFNGREIRYRENMMKGSYLAGLGLAMAGVGAVHALAYPLGAFFDIPHGVANAVMLPYVLEYNHPAAMEKFSRIAGILDPGANLGSLSETSAAVSGIIADLAEDVGIPGSLKDLDIPEEEIPRMAEAAMKVERPIKNNPRPMTGEVAEKIYRRAFEGYY